MHGTRRHSSKPNPPADTAGSDQRPSPRLIPAPWTSRASRTLRTYAATGIWPTASSITIVLVIYAVLITSTVYISPTPEAFTAIRISPRIRNPLNHNTYHHSFYLFPAGLLYHMSSGDFGSSQHGGLGSKLKQRSIITPRTKNKKMFSTLPPLNAFFPAFSISRPCPNLCPCL